MGHRCHRTGDDCLRRNLRSSAKLWGMKSIVSLRFKVPHEIMADSNLLSVARPGTERERESALCICGICATTDRSKRNSGESTSWVLPVCHHRISLLCCSSHPEDTTRHSIYRLQIAFFLPRCTAIQPSHLVQRIFCSDFFSPTYTPPFKTFTLGSRGTWVWPSQFIFLKSGCEGGRESWVWINR